MAGYELKLWREKKREFFASIEMTDELPPPGAELIYEGRLFRVVRRVHTLTDAQLRPVIHALEQYESDDIGPIDIFHGMEKADRKGGVV